MGLGSFTDSTTSVTWSQVVEPHQETFDTSTWIVSEVGNWLSKDPIGIAGGLNQHVFADNNPVNFRDPMGLLTMDEEFMENYLRTGSMLDDSWRSRGSDSITVKVGVSADAQMFGGGTQVDIGYAIGYSRAEGFSHGVIYSQGVGPASMCSASRGLILEVTNAKGVGDLKGYSQQYGGSLGEVIVFGADRVLGDGYDGFELNLGYGGGLPFELHWLWSPAVGWTSDGGSSMRNDENSGPCQ